MADKRLRSWIDLYRIALQDSVSDGCLARINEAHAVALARMCELQSQSTVSSEELRLLHDALHNLCVLRNKVR